MTAILAITKKGLKTAEFLASSLSDSQVVDLRGNGRLRAWVAEHFHDYQGHVFIMSLGIVYRVISELITTKYKDPAVVVVDDARRFAISALSGHEGGANRLSGQVAGILGCEPVITTASETNRSIVLGVGCRRGVSAHDVRSAVECALDSVGRQVSDVRLVASVDIKRNEDGLHKAFDQLQIPLVFVDSNRIRSFCGSLSESPAARQHLNLPGVSEPCALLSSRHGHLISPRTSYGPVTVAISQESLEPLESEERCQTSTMISTNKASLESPQNHDLSFGPLIVVGTGPGDDGNLTFHAAQALSDAEVIAGYPPYLDQVASRIDGKPRITTGMRQEVDRCQKALEAAREGKSVALVSGGDAGVYGLAGLMLELMEEHEQPLLRVIPGVTSATACAALLGAPLTHDFVVISLSNLLTDSELIERRLMLAAQGDFVTVLYNPQSHRRKQLFQRAGEIFLEHRSKETPVGLVQNGWREEEHVSIIKLEELTSQDWVDMRTTVVIGNSCTRTRGGRMITPRGYQVPTNPCS